jgi:hypothetical protein
VECVGCNVIEIAHSSGASATQTTYVPTLRTEWRVGHFTMEAEGGAEFGSRDFGQTTEDTTRYYFSLGYRYDF